VVGLDICLLAPVAQGVSNELRFVVDAQKLRPHSTLFTDLIEHGDGAYCSDASSNIGRRCFCCELVSYVQNFDGPAIRRFIELKVNDPNMVRVLNVETL